MVNPTTYTSFGTDPEGFFKRDGEIIGSEKIIAKEGIDSGGFGRIIRDGVQFELNPKQGISIEDVVYRTAGVMTHLYQMIRKHKGTEISFDGLVEVSQQELDTLSADTRVLGCMPSLNIYGAKSIDVDAVTYRKRSAGGHIHMGLPGIIYNNPDNIDHRQRLVPLMDIFVGNTCVLLDRDPGAAERRENYGRAGEYRLPKHGLEYRTISNFWLRHPALQSLVFNLANFAIGVLITCVTQRDIEEELIQVVNIRRVEEAINTNNFDLAYENFQIVKPFLLRHATHGNFALNNKNIAKFEGFVASVKQDGLERFVPVNRTAISWDYRNHLEKFQDFLNRV